MDTSTDIIRMRCILFANLSNNTMTHCIQSPDITWMCCILFTTSSNNTRTHCIQFPYITWMGCILFTNSSNHTRMRCIPSTDITQMRCILLVHVPFLNMPLVHMSRSKNREESDIVTHHYTWWSARPLSRTPPNIGIHYVC